MMPEYNTPAPLPLSQLPPRMTKGQARWPIRVRSPSHAYPYPALPDTAFAADVNQFHPLPVPDGA